MEFGIQIPPAEQAAFWDRCAESGGDLGTEEGLADIRRIVALSGDAHDTVAEIFEQRVPEKYMILRMCRAVREKLEGSSAVLDEIEARYAQ